MDSVGIYGIRVFDIHRHLPAQKNCQSGTASAQTLGLFSCLSMHFGSIDVLFDDSPLQSGLLFRPSCYRDQLNHGMHPRLRTSAFYSAAVFVVDKWTLE